MVRAAAENKNSTFYMVSCYSTLKGFSFGMHAKVSESKKEKYSLNTTSSFYVHVSSTEVGQEAAGIRNEPGLMKFKGNAACA